jgi:hypothetical protein
MSILVWNFLSLLQKCWACYEFSSWWQ